MHASIHKNMKDILSKDSVELTVLMDTQSGKTHKCVVLEGAPGVGKTTLAWYICRKWGEGELFQEYSLVLLLSLRDESVHNAMTLFDIISYLYNVQRRHKDILEYLEDCNGKDTLIIMEGLDEVPKDVLTKDSIFSRLLAGEKLPDATIIVTIRSSAAALLWEKWEDQITGHYEILGFKEENIMTIKLAFLTRKSCLPSTPFYARPLALDK